MARTSTGTAQRSKVRIFFVEADLAPGDMQDLTHALNSAIRPPTIRAAIAPKAATTMASATEEQLELDGPVFEVEEPLGEAAIETARTKSGPRTYRKPTPVEIDMSGGGTKSFEDFANEKTSADSAHRAKYLVAATWLHDFAHLETITADHVFTCYKAADWAFDVIDPGATLRLLKKEGLGTTERGSFSINHLGLSEVKKMKAE